MGAELKPGERLLPSALDVQLLQEMHDDDLDDLIGALARDRM
jgi:hypothetical protein